MLLNPGPHQPGQEWPSAEERKQKKDEFFIRAPWRTLPQTACGASALKQKLSVQLQKHIEKHVKILQKEIQNGRDDCVAELKLLGTGKDTPEEMRKEFIKLCRDSERLIIPAVNGTYNPLDTSFFPIKLRSKDIPPQISRTRCQKKYSIYWANGDIHGEPERLKQEAKSVLHQRKGTELALDYNQLLVYNLFQIFSKEGPSLAQQHKDNLGVICNEFLGEVIDHIWPHRMREPLRKEIIDPQMKSILEKAQNEVELLQKDLCFEVQLYDSEHIDRSVK